MFSSTGSCLTLHAKVVSSVMAIEFLTNLYLLVYVTFNLCLTIDTAIKFYKQRYLLTSQTANMRGEIHFKGS